MQQRADNLLLALAELTDSPDPRPVSLLEAGCGFGALAAFLSVDRDIPFLCGVDIRDDYVEVARRATSKLDARRPRFEVCDMR